MKLLCLSDKILPFIYSPQVSQRFTDIDLIISCGDLPYYYLEYVLDKLCVPLLFVRGNHDNEVEYKDNIQRRKPHGAIDLHRKVISLNGILCAGVEGSLRYRPGNFQYSQSEMWSHVIRLIPSLFRNRSLYGRYLDIFVTHAPPKDIHDASDLPHQGISAYRWLLSVFKPAYYLHGHVHIYRPDTIAETKFGKTWIVNSYGFRELELDQFTDEYTWSEHK